VQQQITKVSCRRPHRICGENRNRLIQCSLGPQESHSKQDLDPFSCVCRAKLRETAWQTDWQTPGIIDRNSLCIKCGLIMENAAQKTINMRILEWSKHKSQCFAGSKLITVMGKSQSRFEHSLKIRFGNRRLGLDSIRYFCDSIWAVRFDSRIIAGCCSSVLFSV